MPMRFDRLFKINTDFPSLLLNATIALLLLALLILPKAAAADDSVAGGLLLRSETGESYAKAPAVETDVRIDVTGVVARTTVSQRFQNPTGRWMEGIYVFPLPEDAAVDTLTMKLGDKVIAGVIAEREQAKKTYTEAKSEGRAASLIEQERPNMFTASVANIPPGDAISISIEYQEKLTWRDGGFGLRMPLVVGPRYIPPLRPLTVVGGGPSLVTDPVPDAGRITPPLRHPDEGLANPVRIAVSLNAGMALTDIRSASHKILVQDHDADRGDGPITVTLAAGPVPADRDFVLDWKPAAEAMPKAVMFEQVGETDRHVLMMVMPPATAADRIEGLPREVVFILDTSGSMHGDSIAQAKAAMKFALERLRPEDRFNLIRFNNTYSKLYPEAQQATPDRIQQALGYLAALEAEGGTEMLPALKAALDRKSDPSRLRQVIFLTDGAIGNETELFRHIASRRGDSRLFPIGMGSAPNGHFMTRAARIGRGTYTFIGDLGQASPKMADLFRKLERPAITDLAVRYPGGVEAEAYPDVLPDLYHGEPLVLTAKLPLQPAGDVEIGGRIAGERWSTLVSLNAVPANAGIGKLWARDKIAALNESRAFGEDPDQVRTAVTEVALAYGLVTKHTSMVAVDVTPIRPTNVPVDSADVPLNLPDGWSYDALTGERVEEREARAKAAPAPMQLASFAQRTTVHLPQTATPAGLYLLTGLTVLALALLLLFVTRRKPA